MYGLSQAIRMTHLDTYCGVTEKVNETMLEMGVPETMPSYASVDFTSAFEEGYSNGGCKITCNGKPAWFKGKFPCFGKLAVRLQTPKESMHV